MFYVLVSAPFANLVNIYIKSKDPSDQKIIFENSKKSEFYQKNDQAIVKLKRIQSNKE